jgi:hypothetical protein
MSRRDPSNVAAPGDYTNLVVALDAESGKQTDECFPDLRPTPLELVRSCPPSPALVDLLAHMTLEQLRASKTDLAAELLSLALCARSALRDGRALG